MDCKAGTGLIKRVIIKKRAVKQLEVGRISLHWRNAFPFEFSIRNARMFVCIWTPLLRSLLGTYSNIDIFIFKLSQKYFSPASHFFCFIWTVLMCNFHNYVSHSTDGGWVRTVIFMETCFDCPPGFSSLSVGENGCAWNVKKKRKIISDYDEYKIRGGRLTITPNAGGIK